MQSARCILFNPNCGWTIALRNVYIWRVNPVFQTKTIWWMDMAFVWFDCLVWRVIYKTLFCPTNEVEITSIFFVRKLLLLPQNDRAVDGSSQKKGFNAAHLPAKLVHFVCSSHASNQMNEVRNAEKREHTLETNIKSNEPKYAMNFKSLQLLMVCVMTLSPLNFKQR